MSWLDAVPVALLSAVWLFAPGLLVTYGYGLRGLGAWGLAPVVSVAIAATTAVVAQEIGVPWSVLLVVIVTLVIALAVALVAFLVRRRWPAAPTDPRRVTLAAAAGLVPAFVVGFVTLMHGMISPDALSQTYDAALHYNAVASILDTKDASSLVIGNLATPGAPNTFYPAGWHDIVSLVVMTGRFSIPVAVNLTSGVIGIVVWPVSCLLLVRQIVGRSAVAMAVTGLVSVAFTSFPWDLLGFGVLWANLLGMALVPAVLAVVLSITGLAREDAIGRGRAWLILPVAFVGAGFAHPNAVFTVLTLAVVPVFMAIVRRTLRLRSAGRNREGLVELGMACLVFLVLWLWSVTTPALAGVRDFTWAPIESPARAIGEALFLSTTGYGALWVLALLVLCGIVLSRRMPELRWVVAGFVITAALFVLSASVNDNLSKKFTGYWYNDPHRLAAMLPITGIPLAVVAVVWLGRQLTTFVQRQPRLANVVRGRAFAGSTLVVLLVLGALTGGFYVGRHAVVIQNLYVFPASQPGFEYADPAEAAFFTKVEQHTPADTTVANDPWDGSALLWALGNRRVLFPHMGVAPTPAQLYLAAHLDQAATNPKVCRIANNLHVGYLIVGDADFWPWDVRTTMYPGVQDPGHAKGFQLVLADGPRLRLYQLTACSTQG